MVLVSFQGSGLKKNEIFKQPLFPGDSDGKESAWNVEDPDLIPGLRISPEEGNVNPLQYSCLENSMDGEAWQATVHGVTNSRTQLCDFHFHF